SFVGIGQQTMDVEQLCEQGRAEFHYGIMGSSVYLSGTDTELEGAQFNDAMSAVPAARSKLDTLSWARWVALFTTSPFGMGIIDYVLGSQAVQAYNRAYRAECTDS
ncbi:MAG: hypothetical protein ABEI52_03975, partial [Halobacteriaceae archaeon]